MVGRDGRMWEKKTGVKAWERDARKERWKSVVPVDALWPGGTSAEVGPGAAARLTPARDIPGCCVSSSCSVVLGGGVWDVPRFPCAFWRDFVERAALAEHKFEVVFRLRWGGHLVAGRRAREGQSAC